MILKAIHQHFVKFQIITRLKMARHQVDRPKAHSEIIIDTTERLLQYALALGAAWIC